MSKTVAEKIITPHVVEGKTKPGESIGLKIDHTLTQDSTGTSPNLSQGFTWLTR